MFNKDFYPTPQNVIEMMLEGEELKDKKVLEPSAGKGNIVDYLLECGAEVLACESNEDLRHILSAKCTIVENDFLSLTSDKVSHIDLIIMNPPFSADEHHLLHAWEIAPDGCKIISLCNWETYRRAYTKSRVQLKNIVESYGNCIDLGNVFAEAERTTDVSIGLVRIQKPFNSDSSQEFEGFFLEEEEAEKQENGIMSYNVVRDLVNRYVSALKVYDSQLGSATHLNSLLNGFYGTSLGFQCTEEGKPKKRNEFKKDLQKAGWKFIFNKMNMEKYSTKGLREDLNKFVEQQTHIPFTMRNIYKMLEIVVGTQSQRMDKALLEVFDRLTERYNENRYKLEGWKTNSHYLVNKKFIFPWGAESNYRGGLRISYSSQAELLHDTDKALCYITGVPYEKIRGIETHTDMVAGQWYETHFFRIKCFKKGTIHCEFREVNIWELFNQRVAKLKGYPLPEKKEQTKWQEKQTGRKQAEPMIKKERVKSNFSDSNDVFNKVQERLRDLDFKFGTNYARPLQAV